MACLHYFLDRGFNVEIAHFVHEFSAFASIEKQFVNKVANQLGVKLHLAVQEGYLTGQSKEEFWRNGRYEFFKRFDCPVITGHTLDDAVEWYVYSALNGQPKVMNYQNGNVVRPFILYKKSQLVSFLKSRNVQWLEDPSNKLTEFAKRNLVRHSVLPEALKVNPGLYNMVKRMIVEKYNARVVE